MLNQIDGCLMAEKKKKSAGSFSPSSQDTEAHFWSIVTRPPALHTALSLWVGMATSILLSLDAQFDLERDTPPLLTSLTCCWPGNTQFTVGLSVP